MGTQDWESPFKITRETRCSESCTVSQRKMARGCQTWMGTLCFSCKTHVEDGSCARPFQPRYLSRVPQGLRPDESEVPCNVCVFLIKVPHSEIGFRDSRKRRWTCLHRRSFSSFKPRQPLSLHKAEKAAPFPGTLRKTLCSPEWLIFKTKGCTPWPGDLSS